MRANRRFALALAVLCLLVLVLASACDDGGITYLSRPDAAAHGDAGAPTATPTAAAQGQGQGN